MALRQLNSEPDLDFCADLARQLRVDSIRCSTAAGSGHPTSSMSAADLMAVLLARHLHYDFQRPDLPTNDHLIFSKGHASPLLYAMFKAAGAIDDKELLTYRRFRSRLQGHPTPALPWVDVATGSLGQGLPIAVGVALAGKHLDKLPYRVWVLCGDSEMAEGSMWEALDKAAYYELGNLIAIVDVNRLGQRGETEYGWQLDVYQRRAQAIGWSALVIDGHDVAEIDRAFAKARVGEPRPTMVIAKTIKGKGFAEIQDKNGWHGRALPQEMADRAVAELGGVREVHVEVAKPAPVRLKAPVNGTPEIVMPDYKVGEKVATRVAYGAALQAIGARADVVAMDGEVGNSTFAEKFAAAFPERYFEMFIAEQQLVACAVGMSVRGYVPFASTFAAFFSRAFDFVRMGAISRANIRLVGSHAGVEIGPDGPSQMALEDLAAMRAVHGSTVLYPSDATSAAQLTKLMLETRGVVYMRTTRGAYPVLYKPSEHFRIGGSKLLRGTSRDHVALLGAGVTVHACLEAADLLEKRGVKARVIDLYSVKPIDIHALRAAARVTGGRLVVVEDHYPQGGLGAAVLEALASQPHPPRVLHLAVEGLPGSGTPQEEMRAAGINAEHIARAALRLKSPGA